MDAALPPSAEKAATAATAPVSVTSSVLKDGDSFQAPHASIAASTASSTSAAAMPASSSTSAAAMPTSSSPDDSECLVPLDNDFFRDNLKNVLHNSNPINWSDGDFEHTKESKDAVNFIAGQVTKEAFHSFTEHSSGLFYTAEFQKFQDKNFHAKILSNVMPALIKLLVPRSTNSDSMEEEATAEEEKEFCFDANHLSPQVLQDLRTASEECFPDDYVPSNNNSEDDDDDEDENKRGSVYLKVVVMTVDKWITACSSLLEGTCRGPRQKGFVRKLRKKLNDGMKEDWWKPTEYYSMPYVGESSRQTFSQRMLNNYPSLYHSFADQSDAQSFVFKVANVDHANAIQSRGQESFLATLLSECTKLTREKKGYGQDYIGCSLLWDDCSAFNIAICGDRIGYAQKIREGGYEISEWLSSHCWGSYRNMLIMECPSRNVVVLCFVIQHEPKICEYINTHPRESAQSRRVRDNTDAPDLPRKDRGDITIEDVCRYFGYIVGSKMTEEGRGVHNEEYRLESMKEELDLVYERVVTAYEDSENFYAGYFFPPSSDRNMRRFFERIRDEENMLRTREYRREFFLSKEQELEHLLYKNQFEVAEAAKINESRFGKKRGGFFGDLMKKDKGDKDGNDPDKDWTGTQYHLQFSE